MGNKKNLAVLATGSGKTYLACLAAYRLLNYTPTKRILFLVDRNNLARQTESEFSVFDRTEGQQKLGNLYTINRLKKEEDIKGDIVISTIQKLFCVLTGQKINDSDEDAEDEKAKADEEKDSKTVVDLGNDLKLPPDYFQLIMVDECHRSIYGKWKKVLDYFSGVTVLGLTATPTPEAYAYFNKNVIEEYTYDDSVVDGVNVPPRVYRIITDITAHGGTIEKGTKITETSKRTGKSEIIDAGTSVEYGASALIMNDGYDHNNVRAYGLSDNADHFDNNENGVYNNTFFWYVMRCDFVKGLEWAISFVNNAVQTFAENKPDEITNIEIYFPKENKKRVYLGNEWLWMADIMEHNLPVVLTDISFVIKKTVINSMRNSSDHAYIKGLRE